MPARTKMSSKSKSNSTTNLNTKTDVVVDENVNETAPAPLKGVAASFEQRLRMLKFDLRKTETPVNKDEMFKMISDANALRGNSTRKTLRDPNTKKRPPTAYFLFSNDVRPIIQKKKPELKMTDISKVIGQQWRNLNDSQKKKYIDKAAKLKAEFDKNNAETEETDE